MWRRPQNDPALPVPTFYPDDGPDSHLHSPRRRPVASQDMPTISTALTAPPAGVALLSTLSSGCSRLQTASTSSTSSFPDPFNEAAYQEWINSLGLGPHQAHGDTNTVWPTLTNQGSHKGGVDPIMGSVPAYLSSTMRDAVTGNSMHLPRPSLDEDIPIEMLKVPTNTPTAFLGADHGVSGWLARPRSWALE
jgi:hypothetical protein